MASASIAIITCEFLSLAIICLLLIRYYKSNLVTTDVTLSVYISWVLGLAGILLLPYDVAITFTYYFEENKTNDGAMVNVWRFIYWSTFLLAWLCLPVQLEYHNSGKFSFYGKLKDAILRNIFFGIIATVCGFIYIIYMVSTSHGSPSQVIGFLMAMSNTYGVVLIIIMMGNGLVSLPKRLWEMSDYEGELIRLYLSAPAIESAFQDARYELEDCELEVKKAEHIIEVAVMGGSFDKDLLNYVSILNNRVASFEFSNRASTRQYVTNQDTLEDREKFRLKQSFIDLNSRLIKAQFQARACDSRWKNLIKDCIRYEELLNENETIRSDRWCVMPTAISSQSSSSSSCISRYCNELWNHANNLWTYRFHRIFCRSLAVICCLSSTVILWSELMLTTGWGSPIGILMTQNDIESNANNSAFIQLIALGALSYMSICTYWSLFRVNFGYAYSLQGPNQTTHSSLIFNGEYFSRLQFTLGYNFLLILNVRETERTAFSKLMSNMELIPVFGSSFLVYVPVIMIIVSLLTFFNGYAKLFRLFGIDTEDAVASSFFSCKKFVLVDEDLEQYNSGKAIVSSELKRINKLSDSSSHSTHEHSKDIDDRRKKHEIKMGRYPDDKNHDFDIEEAKRKALFAINPSKANTNGKYTRQNVSYDADSDVEEDPDIDTFTFTNIHIDSSSSHSTKNSSKEERSQSSFPSFSTWKVFNNTSFSPFQSKVAYNSADKAREKPDTPYSPTSPKGSFTDTINPMASNPRISNERDSSTSRPKPKPPVGLINFSIEDEDDDSFGGRYSGV